MKNIYEEIKNNKKTIMRMNLCKTIVSLVLITFHKSNISNFL